MLPSSLPDLYFTQELWICLNMLIDFKEKFNLITCFGNLSSNLCIFFFSCRKLKQLIYKIILLDLPCSLYYQFWNCVWQCLLEKFLPIFFSHKHLMAQGCSTSFVGFTIFYFPVSAAFLTTGLLIFLNVKTIFYI